MREWTAPEFIDELKVTLDARAGLDGVTVATGPLGADTPREAITFHDVAGDEEWSEMAKGREESYTIRGTTWIVKAGKGEATIKAARDRAAALLAELGATLREHSELADVMDCQLGGIDMDQGTNDDGRWCQLTFRIKVLASV